MIRDAYSIAFDPLLPWWLVAALATLFVALVGYALVRRARGALLRLLAGAALTAILLNPSLVQEQRAYQKDIGLVVIDRSPSQTLENRTADADAAVAKLRETAKNFEDLDLRVVETKGGVDYAEKGTQLFDTVREALADIPQKRLAALVLVTDGQVHDAPAAARELGITAPVHLVMTGNPDGKDRRIVVTQSPTYGLVGKSVDVTFQVDDLGSPALGVARVTIRRDGQRIADIDAPVGKPQSVPLDIVHGGQTVFEIEVARAEQELTLVNNAAVFAVNGVRDRLRVLLISGEPYPGERTWRNLLKSDPSVELIHFTILRPPNKQDATPINELALIAFPVDELFDIKLREFDLIIFDRFQHLGILPDEYFQHIVEYVKEGGAVFESAGPSSAGQFSLYRTPLEQIFAAQPTGEIRTQGFQPQVTPVGLRHPVTNDLLPPDQDKPSWGRWFREMPASSARGVTVMSGIDGLPLLILDRVGKGRVAQLFSDQLWLWSKGFEGGGPHAELIRRIGHWLMQEPDLEEEDLRATVIDGRLEVRRQSLTTQIDEVEVTRPDGTKEKVKLRDDGRGRATGSIAAAEQGLYKVTDGTRQAFAASGALNSKEWSDPRASASLLQPLVDETAGGVQAVSVNGQPNWRRVPVDGAMAGSNWLGLRQNADYTVTGVTNMPLLPAWAALLLALGLVLLAWRRESK
ncbi:hypothetical protein [Dongia deserti]|uniref:hypothetical protein n=1 Tax=Dongia deserti TaxID=2268030 RepID=UPI000E65A667|nr:hypothetical protein [Dongia deserti]